MPAWGRGWLGGARAAEWAWLLRPGPRPRQARRVHRPQARPVMAAEHRPGHILMKLIDFSNKCRYLARINIYNLKKKLIRSTDKITTMYWFIFKSFIVPTLVPRALTAAMCQSLANFPGAACGCEIIAQCSGFSVKIIVTATCNCFHTRAAGGRKGLGLQGN